MVESADNAGLCPLCSIRIETTTIPYIDSIWTDLDLFRDLTISYCQSCGIGFTQPECSRSSINRFYSESYRRPGSPHYLAFHNMERPILPHEHSLSQLLLAQQYVGMSPRDLFLDIGAGSGASFSSASMLLDEPELCAIERNKGASEAFDRLYRASTVLELGEVVEWHGRPKLVLASHSLEHFQISELIPFLTQLKECLSKDGIVVAEVPHVDLRRHTSVRAEDAPHLLFFSRLSLRMAFELAGFEILFLDTCGPRYGHAVGREGLGGGGSVQRTSVSFRGLVRSCWGLLPAWCRKRLSGVCVRIGIRRVNASLALTTYGSEDGSWLRVVAR